MNIYTYLIVILTPAWGISIFVVEFLSTKETLALLSI